MNIENSSEENTPENLNSIPDTSKETDHIAPLQKLPQKNSLSKSSQDQEEIYPLRLKEEGGNLSNLVQTVTNSLATSEESHKIIESFFKKHSRGFGAALTLICRGTACPFLHTCPLYKAKQELPVSKSCPVEGNLTQLWVNKHLIGLGIDDYDNPEYSFDMDILYEMAAHELIKWRLASHLSESGALVSEQQVSGTPTGEPIFAEVISPILQELDRHSRITMKLRDALLATRKAQAQAGKEMSDPTQKSSELVRKFREIQRRKREKIKDIEFDVIEDPKKDIP
jgi:hypothetical protein